MVDKIFVREYLESLRERSELDLIFGFLLQAMGFQIVSLPKETVGVPQQGRDVIAIGPDKSGKIHKWSFELKGQADKDIDSSTFSKKDGIRESLIESLDAPFENNTIPGFDKLPIKFVVVHNGIVKPNFKPIFDNFIKKNFKKDKQFEDWDIHRLTDLFYDNLFGEYLFTDETSLKLFKRMLVFISVPEYEFEDLKALLNRIVAQYKEKPTERARDKFLATVNLLAVLMWHYGKESNNLFASKHAINIINLKIWNFLLREGQENEPIFLESYSKLLFTQHGLLNEYFSKTLRFAATRNGLFSRDSVNFEPLGQRLICYDYLDDLIYFFYLDNLLSENVSDDEERYEKQKKALIDIVDKNCDAFTSLIYDRQIIPIIHFFLFFFSYGAISQNCYNFLSSFLQRCFENMIIRQRVKGVWPHAGGSLDPIIELEASRVRPSRYLDSSSIMIAVLIELVAIFNLKDLYRIIRTEVEGKINLQVAYPTLEDRSEFEINFFDRNVDDMYYVETGIVLPESFDEYRNSIIARKGIQFQFRCDAMNLEALRILAESFFKNDPAPWEWRRITQYMLFE